MSAGLKPFGNTSDFGQIDKRLKVLEKYGIYKTLDDLKNAVGDSTLPYTLLSKDGRIEYSFVSGDFTTSADNVTVIALNKTPVNVGALVRQSVKSISFKRNATGSLPRSGDDVMSSMAYSPADFGGIQKAIDAALLAAGARGHVPVALEQDKIYTLTEGLVFDTMRTSLLGYSTIDGGATPSGTTLVTVDCNNDSYLGGSYGYKGRIWGNIRLTGESVVNGAYVRDPVTNGKIGLFLNGTKLHGSAQIQADGLTVAACQTGIRFGNHGYNSMFSRLEVFNCETCIHWPAGNVDPGERNSFVSATLYNSNTAIVANDQAAELFFWGGSIDYTQSVAKSGGSAIFLSDMHIESNRWGDSTNPYAFVAEGDGAWINIRGGKLLNTAVVMPSAYLAYVGAGARMDLDSVMIHNMALTRPNPDTPTAFFNAFGRVSIRNSYGLDGGLRPDRLNAQSTSLADPSFESPTWDDLVYLKEDTGPITDRHIGTNLVLSKVAAGRRSGTMALSARKGVNGEGSLASFCIMRMPIKPGEKVLAGLHFKNKIAGATAPMSVQWMWGRFDRFDQYGIPLWHKLVDLRIADPTYNNLGEPVVATDQYQMSVCGKLFNSNNLQLGLSGITAPIWATDFVAFVRMFDAPANTELLFDDIWCDTW